MTVIAYKNGVMASDSVVNGGSIIDGSAGKIARNKAGDLMGASGDLGWCSAMQKWFIAGERGKRPHRAINSDGTYSCCAIIVRADQRDRVWVLESCADHAPFHILISERSGYAAGSGWEVARGAMFAGADAIQSAIAACSLVNTCGGDVHALGHKGPLRTIKAKASWQ